MLPRKKTLGKHQSETNRRIILELLSFRMFKVGSFEIQYARTQLELESSLNIQAQARLVFESSNSIRVLNEPSINELSYS